jgi:class 3 adenylate cyclase
MPASGPAKLIVRMPDGTTHEYELTGDRVLHIGRAADREISIPSDYVSRRHAMISPTDGRFVIKDDGSTNGLLINGRLVREPHPLASGDRVQVGDVVLIYEEESADDPFATAIYEQSPAIAEVREPARVSRPPGTWTILYTDLVAHTRQLTQLGDVAGQRWLRMHNTLLRKYFDQYDGLVDKGLGDGFLVTFASARRAVQCAVAIQRELRDYNSTHADAPILVRMGLHTGEVLREGDELFGSAVIFAARVIAKAGAGQILISELLYRLIHATGEFPIVVRGSYTLKGLDGRHRLYEVTWQTA